MGRLKDLDKSMFHGYATAKEDLDYANVKKGDHAIITAYYPYGDVEPIVGLWFGEGKWLTIYDVPKEEFKERFDVDRSDEAFIVHHATLKKHREAKMFKENGRKKPADSKEMANVMGKTYECFKCGYSEVRNGVVFGEVIRCPKCFKGTLEEQIDV